MIPCSESWIAWHVSHEFVVLAIPRLHPPICALRSTMSSSELSAPPPLYAQQSSLPEVDPHIDPQILIIPATDSLRFQQGFLGADGERAAIEGELQLKEAHSGRWRKLSVVIRALACHSLAEPTFFYPQGRWTSVLLRLHTSKSSNYPKHPLFFTNPRTTKRHFSNHPSPLLSRLLQTRRSAYTRPNLH